MGDDEVSALDDYPLYKEASDRGLPVRHKNGMPRFNRERMYQDDMARKERRPGDLFAVFKDDFGATHIEFARMEDYREGVIDDVIKKNRFKDDMLSDPDNIVYLIGVVMISNSHGFSFDNFVHLLRHDLSMVYDSLQLALWVEVNREFFMPPSAEAVRRSATDRKALEAENAALDEAA